MGYEYITENNLINRQNYMYSEYRGEIFLQDYLESRQRYIEHTAKLNDNEESTIHISRYELQTILDELITNKWNKIIKEEVDSYVKSFEVRKRIYDEYDEKWKPCCNASFEDYETYLIFSEILLIVYTYTECTKYYSCLLKINDSMISVENKLTNRQKNRLATILKQEISILHKLLKGGE